MKRVLNVTDSVRSVEGGTSVSVPAIALATAQTGRYSTTLLYVRGNQDGGGRQIDYKVLSTDFKWSRILSNMLFGGVIDKCVQWADIVHIHGLWQRHCIGTGLIAARRGKPVIFSAHGMLESWALRNKAWKKTPYGSFIERPNLRRAALLRALTAAEAEDYRRYGLRCPIAIVPNGVNESKYVGPDVCFSSWPRLRGLKIVLYLGRIHYKKGVNLLAKAWSVVAPSFLDAHLVIAGPDSEGSQALVEKILVAGNVRDRVTFTGPVYDDLKASLLRAASVFTLPSYSEGFSMATLEALAAGVPVIITNACHFQEVEEKGAGWCICPTVSDVTAALQHVLSLSEVDLLKCGRRGQELVSSKYTWASIGGQMADAYDWVLGGPRPTSIEIVER